MAKDRRHRKQKKTITTQPWFRIGVAATAVLIVLVTLLVLLLRSPQEPTDGPLIPVVPTEPTTTTVQTITTSTVTTATADETTTTTEATTTTTETASTTTTTAAATTTTAPPQDGGHDLMVLVNPWNALSEEQLQDESHLVYAENDEYVDARILTQLNAMLEAGAEYGLYVTSGYRSYETQDYLYNNKVDRVIASEGCSYEEALDIAATVVARPGTSEHHTGLAVDLLHNECWELEEYWEDSAAFDWMMEHCADYGFILRYPKESQHITGVIYEPWHYRYVGVEAAKEIMSQGITLEEYLGAC